MASLNGLTNFFPFSLNGLQNINAATINGNPIYTGNVSISFTSALLPTFTYNSITNTILLNLPYSSLVNSGILDQNSYSLFSNKQNLISVTGPLIKTLDNISINKSSASQDGYLSSSDWSYFYAKESVLAFSSPLIRNLNNISLSKSSTLLDGYLSAADYTIFNNKQNALPITLSTAANGNCFIGHLSGNGSVSGIRNCCYGILTGYNLTTGSNNILLGFGTGQVTTTGSNNIILGDYATTTGNDNIGLGFRNSVIGSYTISNSKVIGYDNTINHESCNIFGNSITTQAANSSYMNNIRNVSNSMMLSYNTTTKEITYQSPPALPSGLAYLANNQTFTGTNTFNGVTTFNNSSILRGDSINLSSTVIYIDYPPNFATPTYELCLNGSLRLGYATPVTARTNSWSSNNTFQNLTANGNTNFNGPVYFSSFYTYMYSKYFQSNYNGQSNRHHGANFSPECGQLSNILVPNMNSANCAIWDSNVGGEGCAIAMNGDTMYMSNPADNQSLWWGDEDANGVAGWYINTAGGIATWSERRLKDNITEYNYNDILDKYKKIKLYSYTAKRPITNKKRKSDAKYNEKHHGVMADEIKDIFPEVIGRSKFKRYKKREAKKNDETDEDYNKRCPCEIQSEVSMVEYGKFNLLNIRAIQALTKENDDLKLEVSNLKTRLERLEKLISNII